MGHPNVLLPDPMSYVNVGPCCLKKGFYEAAEDRVVRELAIWFCCCQSNTCEMTDVKDVAVLRMLA